MMETNFNNKYTAEEIKNKFDKLVDTYSNINTGQTSAMDSYLIMDLISKVVTGFGKNVKSILDIGCGAGNYTIKICEGLPYLNCTLVDLSNKMLDQAKERVQKCTTGQVNIIQGDIRDIELPNETFDAVVSGTALHHLRSENEWKSVFQKVFNSIKIGGSFWISDMIVHENALIQKIMHKRYEDYLIDFGGEDLKNWVNEQIELEDTPRSFNFQIELLKEVGFTKTEILHKNATYAAFGGVK